MWILFFKGRLKPKERRASPNVCQKLHDTRCNLTPGVKIQAFIRTDRIPFAARIINRLEILLLSNSSDMRDIFPIIFYIIDIYL